jgi:hypothetical protein
MEKNGKKRTGRDRKCRRLKIEKRRNLDYAKTEHLNDEADVGDLYTSP